MSEYDIFGLIAGQIAAVIDDLIGRDRCIFQILILDQRIQISNGKSDKVLELISRI